MLKGYSVKPIDKKLALDMVVEHHYLHRRPPTSYAYGLYDPNDKVVGVVLYGTPPSATLTKGIAGDKYQFDVIELNRLFVFDYVPRNGESFLIGRSIKLLPKKIIVSFADTAHDHVGYVYQATNFLYTGLSAKRKNYSYPGSETRHSFTNSEGMTAAALREKFGEDFKYVERSRKHRYLFINAKGNEKRDILAALKYPVISEYPKKVLCQTPNEHLAPTLESQGSNGS